MRAIYSDFYPINEGVEGTTIPSTYSEIANLPEAIQPENVLPGGHIDASYAQYGPNGPLVGDLQPAQAGADVTGQNISADTQTVNGRNSEVVVADQDNIANTTIDSLLKKYNENLKVWQELLINGVPVKTVAQLFLEANSEANISRGGIEVDADGVVGMFAIEANGQSRLVDFKIQADKVTFLRPGTDGSDPNDILLFVDGDRMIAHDIEVDTIKVGAISRPELADGALGESSITYSDTAVNVGTQSSWIDICSVTFTPKSGKPLEILFTTFARCTVSSATRAYIRIIRDDGTSIYGGSNGVTLMIADYGSPLSIPAIDGSEIGRPTTYKLQAKKFSNNENVEFLERIGKVTELSRIYIQDFNITATTGTGPTAGTGGGGPNYNPNKFIYNDDDDTTLEE